MKVIPNQEDILEGHWSKEIQVRELYLVLNFVYVSVNCMRSQNVCFV